MSISSFDTRMGLVVLGAGIPHNGNLPSALREPVSGTSILQWQLDASGCSKSDVIFVAGYQAELIVKHYPELMVVENKDWAKTGSGISMLTAPFSDKKSVLLCYSDILFRKSVSVALSTSGADIAVAWDSAWKYRYSQRNQDELVQCEKVIVRGGQVMRLGVDLPVDWADGEFIGLVWFSERAIKRVDRLRKFCPESLRKSHLSEYIEYFRAVGLSVSAIDVAGDWAEFNESRDIAHFILGTKAETLARLRGMVSHALIEDQVVCTVKQWRNNREAIVDRGIKVSEGRLLVVRSSARSEDSFYASNAGGYDSLLNVEPHAGLAVAIDQVIASYGEASDDDQVLIQPMVSDARLSGVAFTRTLEHGAPWYVINYETNGNTEAITNGSSGDHHTLFLRRDIDIAAVSLPDPSLAVVVIAVREIEDLLSYDALDIEFAVDSEGGMHILQVRPIAVQHTGDVINDSACYASLAAAHRQWQALDRVPPHFPKASLPLYGVMPDWNPAEIIGTTPGALASSLYRYLIMDEVWATQRAEYGYRDVRPAPLLVMFSGHAYVDVRASFASFIPETVTDELAVKLLDFYLDRLRMNPELHDKVEFEIVPTCLGLGFERWEKILRKEGGFTELEVSQLYDGLHYITAEAFKRCSSDLARIEELNKRFENIMSNEDLSSLERVRLLLDDCRRLGTLPFAHMARSAFIAITLLREAETTGIISNEACEDFLSTVRTVSHDLTVDAWLTSEGCLEWDVFVARYGHLRPGTYEINSQRYDSDPKRFLQPLVEHAIKVSSEVDTPDLWLSERDSFCAELESLGLPSEPAEVEQFLRRAIEGREYAKFIFSRNLSSALEDLAEIGAAYGLDREQVGNLQLNEILALRTTSRTDDEIAAHLCELADQGAKAKCVANACKLPPLITAESDLDVFFIGADRPNFIGSTPVIADCLNLNKCSSDVSTDVSGKIILVEQADPGYDWIFSQGVAGLITLYGGANSHMAIRAAEFGLPAAIGVGEQRYAELAQARVLEVSPCDAVLRVVR